MASKDEDQERENKPRLLIRVRGQFARALEAIGEAINFILRQVRWLSIALVVTLLWWAVDWPKATSALWRLIQSL